MHMLGKKSLKHHHHHLCTEQPDSNLWLCRQGVAHIISHIDGMTNFPLGKKKTKTQIPEKQTSLNILVIFGKEEKNPSRADT